MDATLNNDDTVTLYRGGKKLWRGPVAQLPEQIGLSRTAAPTKAKKVRPRSRSQRWADATAAAVAALEELIDVKSEYSDWLSNLPENLANLALGEKLQAIDDIDLDSALTTAQEAEGADLPMGFGRD